MSILDKIFHEAIAGCWTWRAVCVRWGWVQSGRLL